MRIVGERVEELERAAVAMAIRGQRVRIATKDGDVLLEPGTGNIAAVSLHPRNFEGIELEPDGRKIGRDQS